MIVWILESLRFATPQIIFAWIDLLQNSDSGMDAVSSSTAEVPEDARFSHVRSCVSVSYIGIFWRAKHSGIRRGVNAIQLSRMSISGEIEYISCLPGSFGASRWPHLFSLLRLTRY
uniref:Uncharacterized protein n=1 Tax=Rhipicephalus microplus TaxID=6941 RepID=A0A6G5A0F7_RHIMP